MDYGLTRKPHFKLLLATLYILPTLIYGQNWDLQGNIVIEKGVVTRSVTLSCALVDPPYIFIWNFIKFGTDKPIPIAQNYGVRDNAAILGDVTLSGSDLMINNLQLAAEGRYMCQVINKNDEKGEFTTVYIDLTILVPVLKPNLQINDSVPVEGSPVLLTCTVRDGTGPIEYVWNRHTVKEGTFPVTEATGNLAILTAVNRSHIGWYTCTVINEVNEETSDRVYLDVIYGPDEPSINIQPYAISQNGYAANEQEEVTLSCSAPSNPPCHYIWFYNSSQVYSGHMYIIPRISRKHSGMYTCLAQNTQLNTRTQLTISLTVFYLPEGSPSCTALAHNNYQEVALWCSWDGGLPLAQLRWLKSNNDENEIVTNSNATKILKGVDILNGSTYTCAISHPGLQQDVICRTTVSVPSGGPNCSTVATKQNEFIMLTCEWQGGVPKVMLEWNNKQIGDSKESSNIYVFKSNTTYNGKLFTCTALHPMNTEPKECHVQLEAPSLDTYEKDVSILEGNDAQLTCYLKDANPKSEMIWYDKKSKEIIPDSQKYGIFKENQWSNLTIREGEWDVDSGKYTCMALNAVGNSSLLVQLQVQKYPTPPNVTISKLIYSRQRTEVDLEWMTQGTGDLTGFMVQRQASIRSFSGPRRSVQTPAWDTVASSIEPDVRGHKLGGLDPSIVYAFRILAVNHRTTGFPSEVKTPADPPFNAYPAVIGAAVAGMIVAAVASLLVFQYIVRNRENNPPYFKFDASLELLFEFIT
ncbi:V-set and immunoglobulin domain-containing protein 10-like 2 [Bombina bombina]|uniref:V-set and immunoglobulin domain-containing protein 10-like 2 n=1 Tax=Bombina bombina TaxID=8345 RepID=UPI00235AD62F|nr:V-set and immunoglobulin domain-containing protein 10-like 2 [Bombina bombina]